MNIQEAKRIPLPNLLATEGHLPVKKRGDDWWYLSPFREEQTPSFKVNVVKNLYFDFGDGIGGNIFDLAKKIFQTTDLRTTLQRLHHLAEAPISTINPKKDNPAPAIYNLDIKIKPLQHPVLMNYLNDRAVNCLIARQYLMEAHYPVNDKNYFVLAFRNDKGGHELRNKFFKGCTAPKAPTTLIANPVNGRSNELLVFEGFMDFLSYLTLQNNSHLTRDVLILNSLSLLPNLETTFNHYTRLQLFLDNDNAGQKALLHFQGRSYDNCAQELYPQHKDLNEYLLQNRQ